MRARTIVFGLALALAPWGMAVGGPGKDFFNGKDLTGWDGLKEYWQVKDGAIVGSTPDGLKFNTFLCSVKKYADFELKCQVRLKGKSANSGVQIRSEVFNSKKFVVKGPQCDIGDGWWGSLYGEHFSPDGKAESGMMKAAPRDQVNKVLNKDGFNDYHIRCVGKHVTIKINGLTTVDDDFPRIPAEGIIAFQLHAGPPMEVTFRNIQFTDLGRKK